MAESVVSAKRQAAPLLRVGGLQSVVDAVGAGLELSDVPKALIERALVRERSEAPVADILVAVELHLVGFVQSARAHKVDAQVAAHADLLLDAEVVLVV